MTISSKDLRVSENNTEIIKLLSDPFQVDPTGAAVKYQMELTDIQNDSDLKRAFSEQDLLTFDSGYVSSDTYPNLSQDAKNFTALHFLLHLLLRATVFENEKRENEIKVSAYK